MAPFARHLLLIAALPAAACTMFPVPEDERAFVSLLNSLNGGPTAGGQVSATATLPPATGLERSYDLNGDGFHDLVFGDFDFNSNAGRVLIYHGAAGGIANYSVGAGSTGADTILGGPTTSDFGQALAMGDIDGDGYPDVVVGADLHNSGTGAVYIFYNEGGAGISSRDLASGGSAGTTLTGENTGDDFGTTVNVGDYNGDGYADVIVHAPEYNTNHGRLYVFLSRGSTGIAANLGAAGADVIVTGSATRRFFFDDYQTALLADVNGDGRDDIVACNIDFGVPYVEMLVFHSTGGAMHVDLGAGGTADSTVVGIPGVSTCSQGLAVGDINGDGFADVVTSYNQYNTDQGRAYIFYGGSAGITAGSLAAADTNLSGGAGTCRFGSRLRLADVNNDGYDDAIVGERGGSCALYHYYIFHGSAGGINDQDLSGAGTADTTLSEAGQGLTGTSIGAGDFNGDGFADMAATDAGSTEDIWIFYGTAGGITSGTTASAGTVLDSITNFHITVPR